MFERAARRLQKWNAQAHSLEAMMVDAGERRTSTRAKLEVAQDAFVVALRRLRALEEVHARLRAPLDLAHAHQLWSIVSSSAPLPRPKGPGIPMTLVEEMETARIAFVLAREELRTAEAEAEAARAA